MESDFIEIKRESEMKFPKWNDSRNSYMTRMENILKFDWFEDERNEFQIFIFSHVNLLWLMLFIANGHIKCYFNYLFVLRLL